MPTCPTCGASIPEARARSAPRRGRRPPRRRAAPGLYLGALLLALAALALLTRAAPVRDPGEEDRAGPARLVRLLPPVEPFPEVSLLTEEGIRFYSAGRYPDACQRFLEARAREPANPALRLNVARCFEGWGWESLRAGKAEEATLLFRQGLGEEPHSPPLLTGLALAQIHAGRPQQALDPLERAVELSPDPEATLLLARLHDQGDRSDRAVAHLQRLLERYPEHEGARRLLAKIERERRAEAGYQRIESRRFVVKYRGREGLRAARTALEVLEEASRATGRDFDFFPAGAVTVILYPDRRFREVTGVHHWASGLFDGKIRLPVGSALERTPALERLLRHEYTHAVVHLLSRGRAPRWLHEGLAQHAERGAEEPPPLLPGAMTLAGLEALLSDGDPAKAQAGYQVSLWVVRDLLQRGGMPRMRELLARLGAGEPAARAIPRVYGLPLAELESHWSSILGG
jgi:tetratricopeptide (TPR) repeat protein